MNVKNIFESTNNEIKNIENRLKTLKEQYNKAIDITVKFLNECEKNGVKKVSIRMRHESVPTSMKFPFGVNDSVFSEEYNDGRPAIWKPVVDVGLGGGCGNSGQYQIKEGALLVDGVYHLKDGVWKKVD